MTTLRLGPLPKTEAVKLTIMLTTELKQQLDRYAELHSQTWGDAVDATALIPHMLEAFMARDRGFKKSARGGHAA
ncbi:DUF2274 domain-containing protein [Amnimonas aquatica]|uniref:DUF2274 domain-containing protein n=1 Tax=Amnimonas aquatica TaxID=2094561 RepID=A0A2P6AUG7_9GAMM|nr:DUF2274 domain-containing protein [Amnimonas aquatica]PQA50127.1 DUF2274 domain-containing protein [Amnimonas aquatica]